MPKQMFKYILLLLIPAFAGATPLISIHRKSPFNNFTTPTAQQLAQISIVNANKDLDSMLYYAELASKMALVRHDRNGMLDAWLAKARYYFHQKNTDKTFIYTDLVKQYGKQFKNDSAMAEAYFLCGEVYCLQLDYRNSLTNFFRALNITDKINSKTLAAKILSNIGDVYYYLNQFEYALEYYNEAIYIAKGTRDEMLTVAFCLSGVADIYRQQNNYEKSIELYTQSLQLTYKTHQLDIGAFNLWGLAVNCIEINDYERAAYYLKGAIELSKKINGYYRIASCFTAFGNLYTHQKDFVTAKQYFFKSDSIATQCGYTDLIAENSNGRSALYFKQTNFNYAIKEALLAYNLATKESNSALQKAALVTLQKSYEKKGDVKQAYAYQLHYTALNDSINKRESLQNTIQLQVKFELEKENRSKKMLSATDTTESTNNINYEKLLRNISIIGVLFFFTFVLLIYIYQHFKASKHRI